MLLRLALLQLNKQQRSGLSTSLCVPMDPGRGLVKQVSLSMQLSGSGSGGSKEQAVWQGGQRVGGAQVSGLADVQLRSSETSPADAVRLLNKLALVMQEQGELGEAADLFRCVVGVGSGGCRGEFKGGRLARQSRAGARGLLGLLTGY